MGMAEHTPPITRRSWPSVPVGGRGSFLSRDAFVTAPLEITFASVASERNPSRTATAKRSTSKRFEERAIESASAEQQPRDERNDQSRGDACAERDAYRHQHRKRFADRHRAAPITLSKSSGIAALR